ncbi:MULTISPECIES: MFS transporter [Acidobacteriaceae]|uniref:MFS transporter n=1 Tax=Acidobacteriaceae TaxID=204434 RepID=UPI00131EBB76|nr:MULTISPECIES: MFS transporter [Acidobacteriaceae]MDW5266236.1 MFS transporter [Edaphobacter sp.]
MYVVSFLDRANVGFAKQALQQSLGISAAAYALGAGLFFITYALFEIPSNLIMQKVGARVWMCRIIVSWGLVSMATMFVTGPISYYVLRLLLGAAEAGFFPGILLYLTYWFPNRTKAQVLGLFYFGAPLALVVGGPISGVLLQIPAASGLQGWQWMFLTEGLLAVIVGIGAFFYLPDRPQNAAWLADVQKASLLKELSSEKKYRHGYATTGLTSLLKNRWVLGCAIIYLLIQMSVYGVVFYLPTEVAVILGRSVGLEVGLVSAIPWVCAIAATYWIPRTADLHRNHRLLAGLTLLAAGIASALLGSGSPPVAMLALCFAASGFIAVQPLFWTFPMSYLADTEAASGLALINVAGAVGGFLAPNAKVWADAQFGFPRAGLYLLAAFSLLAAILVLRVRKIELSSLSY